MSKASFGGSSAQQIKAELDNGESIDLSATPEGHLEIAIHNPLLPFGSVHVESLNHQIQIDGIYGFNESQTYYLTSSTGNISIDDMGNCWIKY